MHLHQGILWQSSGRRERLPSQSNLAYCRDRFLDDSRGQENEQLGLFNGLVGCLEKIAKDGQVAEEWELGDVVVDRFFVDAANYGGVAVIHRNLRGDVFGVDRRHRKAAPEVDQLAD